MLFGIGHDIVDNERIAKLYHQYSERFVNKILSKTEKNELLKCKSIKRQVSYIAKRFATKEAFAKACGLGIRFPILMPNISVINDPLGKPRLLLAPELELWLKNYGVTNFLVSITDEKNLSSSFVILE